MKSYTDLEQSKKLAEFLPLESADMVWANDNDVIVVPSEVVARENVLHDFVPCWSLAALLDVLPYPEIWQDHSTNRWACSSLIKDTEYLWESENPVDSCVEVIIKLHKEGLL